MLISSCPVCLAEISGPDIDLECDIARCLTCGDVFRPSLATQEVPLQDSRPAEKPQSTKVKVVERRESLRLTFPAMGFGAQFFTLLLMTVFWNGIVSVFVVAYINDEFHGGGFFKYFMPVFLTPFVLIGLFMMYSVFYTLLARDIVEIKDNRFSHRCRLLFLGKVRHCELKELQWLWADKGFVQKNAMIKKAGDTRIAGHILFKIKEWERVLGNKLSVEEQRWVFELVHDLIKRERGDR